MKLNDDGKILLKVDASDIIDGSYEIPAGVTAIGNEAFSNCSNLQRITIPVGIMTIGISAFANCSSLQMIKLPAEVTTIGLGAFANCSSLQMIKLPAGVTTIESKAFISCSSLQAIKIPAELKTIEKLTFNGCSSLRTIALPADIKAIGAWAFEECSSLQAITLPAGLMTMGIGAFSDCSSLQAITIPAGVTTLSYNAFKGCSSLQTITLSTGIRDIADAFLGCNNLNCIIIDSDDQAELERITDLLPEELKTKVISKRWLDEVIRSRDAQLARLIKIPQTNPLYRFFQQDARFVSKVERTNNEEGKVTAQVCSKLPDEIFWHINEQIGEGNPYYQKAKALIEREPWPKTPEEFKGYEERIINIVNKCIEQAEHFHDATEEVKTASPAAS